MYSIVYLNLRKCFVLLILLNLYHIILSTKIDCGFQAGKNTEAFSAPVFFTFRSVRTSFIIPIVRASTFSYFVLKLLILALELFILALELLILALKLFILALELLITSLQLINHIIHCISIQFRKRL